MDCLTVRIRRYIMRINTGAEDVPGPGNYDMKTTMGLNSCKFSFRQRIKPQDATTRNYPPPNCYDPEFSQTEQLRFNAITFGIGGRGNVNGKLLDNPGPGTYRIPSVFDKFKRLEHVAPRRFFNRRRGKRRNRSQPSRPREEKEEIEMADHNKEEN